LTKRKHTHIDRAISQDLNYIRAYSPDKTVAELLNISTATLRNIARGKSNSTETTRDKILELKAKTISGVVDRQRDFLSNANDKTRSKNSRSLAKDRAIELSKTKFSYTEATKRQTILKEQKQTIVSSEYLPYIKASVFLSQYQEGKNETQIKDELKRFSERGKELLVTSIESDELFRGNEKMRYVFFSRDPLKETSRVHVRGTVYINNFSAGINQIVRDLFWLFDDNQTLAEAMSEGQHYFDQCFRGVRALDVNHEILNGGIEQPVKKKGDKTRSRGEKYEDLSKWLAERLFLGVYLY